MKNHLFNRDDKGRVLFGRYEFVFQILILLSLISFAIETLPHLQPSTRLWLYRFEVFSVTVFTLEYVLRWLGAVPRRSYILSFYGIVDLVAILPFYLTTGLDLRSLRAFRMLRLIGLFKLVRYSAAIQRYHKASAVGIYYFENEAQPETFASVFHCLWWAIATLSAVGYGDIIPVTVGGRVFTFFVLVIGLGVVAVPSGIFASALSRAREHE
jgi:voltage-gated potassium channel